MSHIVPSIRGRSIGYHRAVKYIRRALSSLRSIIFCHRTDKVIRQISLLCTRSPELVRPSIHPSIHLCHRRPASRGPQLRATAAGFPPPREGDREALQDSRGSYVFRFPACWHRYNDLYSAPPPPPFLLLHHPAPQLVPHAFVHTSRCSSAGLHGTRNQPNNSILRRDIFASVDPPIRTTSNRYRSVDVAMPPAWTLTDWSADRDPDRSDVCRVTRRTAQRPHIVISDER